MKRRRTAFIATVLGIIFLSAIAVGYAFYGNATNSGNTTDPQYLTVTPQGTNAYSNAFSKMLQYDTVNDHGTITFTLCDDQITEITVSETDRDVVLLGELQIVIEQTNITEDYTFSIVDTAGTMTGTFYTAISTSEDDETYSSWTYGSYTIGTGSSYDVDSGIEYIKLRLYVDASFQTPGTALAVKPMNDVTFTLTATVG